MVKKSNYSVGDSATKLVGGVMGCVSVVYGWFPLSSPCCCMKGRVNLRRFCVAVAVLDVLFAACLLVGWAITFDGSKRGTFEFDPFHLMLALGLLNGLIALVGVNAAIFQLYDYFYGFTIWKMFSFVLMLVLVFVYDITFCDHFGSRLNGLNLDVNLCNFPRGMRVAFTIAYSIWEMYLIVVMLSFLKEMEFQSSVQFEVLMEEERRQVEDMLEL